PARHHQRGRDAEHEVSDAQAQTEPGRRGRAREADHGEGVAREALPAQDHEPADDRGHDRDRGAGPERVEHERERPHLLDVEDQVPGEAAHHLPVPWASACISAFSWASCQSWNVAPAGVSVSVMVVTGIPLARAASTCACTSGVAFWLLYTYTLICLPLIWASIVDLSAADGSLPSVTAVRKLGGVSRSSPSAGAIIAKMDSDAPTGVPAYAALICPIVSKYAFRFVVITAV